MLEQNLYDQHGNLVDQLDFSLRFGSSYFFYNVAINENEVVYGDNDNIFLLLHKPDKEWKHQCKQLQLPTRDLVKYCTKSEYWEPTKRRLRGIVIEGGIVFFPTKTGKRLIIMF